VIELDQDLATLAHAHDLTGLADVLAALHVDLLALGQDRNADNAGTIKQNFLACHDQNLCVFVYATSITLSGWLVY
jgi:hypothetical protein